MVLLEPVPSTDETESKASKSSGVTGDESTAAGVVLNGGDGCESDGYETASETEVVNDNESVSNDINISNNNLNDLNGVVEGQQQSEQVSVKETVNEEELLAQMNDAKVEGNKLFGEGLYDEALLKYDHAIQLAPEMTSSADIRSICHNNRATCYFKLEKFEDSIKECTKASELNPTYMKPLLRKAEAHEKLENYDEAITVLKKILELDPSNYQARRTIIRLEPLAMEKREKMKEEMLGKLKDLGNSVLGRFGMSVDNFKAVKDPNTGSYSISFQQ